MHMILLSLSEYLQDTTWAIRKRHGAIHQEPSWLHSGSTSSVSQDSDSPFNDDDDAQRRGIQKDKGGTCGRCRRGRDGSRKRWVSLLFFYSTRIEGILNCVFISWLLNNRLFNGPWGWWGRRQKCERSCVILDRINLTHTLRVSNS